MWFKNIYVFAFTRPFTHTKVELEALLKEVAFTPLGSTEIRHFGFVEAFGKHGDSLVHDSNGNILICARSEEKTIPAPYIKHLVEERVEALESEQGRGATKKEREQFKEDVIFESLPRAFSKINDTHAYISAENNTIVINSSSRTKAENLLSLLRKSLGTLPVTSISPEKQPDEVMTDWVTGYDSGTYCSDSLRFKLGMEAHFNSLGDQSASATVKNQDLSCAEVKAHLDADQFVTKIALEYDDAMSFVLHDDLSIKRIKFFDVIHEQNDDIDSDDVIAKLDADFILMTGELNRMINDLHKEFGVNAIDYLEEQDDIKTDQLVKLNVNQQEVKVESDGFAVEYLYKEAVEFVKETKRVSVSSIQRKFRIGYDRDARIVEQLEENKVVSPAGHNGAREVLIPK